MELLVRTGHLHVSRESLTAKSKNTTVGVMCAESLKANDLRIVELSTNILARLYPTLAIMGPQRQITALRDLALRINPHIELVNEASSCFCGPFQILANNIFISTRLAATDGCE